MTEVPRTPHPGRLRDAHTKFFSEGKNSAFALKPGGTGDVTDSHVLWKKTKGLPFVPSAIADNTVYIRSERHLYAFAEKK